MLKPGKFSILVDREDAPDGVFVEVNGLVGTHMAAHLVEMPQFDKAWVALSDVKLGRRLMWVRPQKFFAIVVLWPALEEIVARIVAGGVAYDATPTDDSRAFVEMVRRVDPYAR